MTLGVKPHHRLQSVTVILSSRQDSNLATAIETGYDGPFLDKY
jgi:hypothetical protein